MTLKFSESPAVQIKEIDLTGIVPAVTSTTGAIVGDFNWGPVGTPVLVGNESELASTFGTPLQGNAYAGDFLSASYFLKYSSSAFVVRATKAGASEASNAVFSAKYVGLLGNSITVSVADESTFADWSFASFFSSSPEGNELHVVVTTEYSPEVLDSDGTVAVEEVLGTVIETYEYVSTDPNSKLENGSSNFVVDVINFQSSWITTSGIPALGTLTLTGGVEGTGDINYVSAYDAFLNKEAIQVDFLIQPAGGQGDTQAISTLHNKLLSVATQRKDCVAVITPPSGTADQMVTYVNDSLQANSSYLIVDGNWFKVYNKYDDRYEFIPSASSTAGVMAATDAVSAPWFSPAGYNRGQLKNAVKLAFNPTKANRDDMYSAGINPVISSVGNGIVLFGDKTMTSAPSAFNRINVRRLFIVLEKAIAIAAKYQLFEFNDAFTRAQFSSLLTPFLRDVQGRRGIFDFKVICNTSNNTSEVIDRNEFVADIFIKPAKAINFIQLNFIATRTGVSFEEIGG